MRPHSAFTASGLSAPASAEDVGMTADELGGDRLHHSAEIEHARFFGHPGVKDDLEQEVAEFFAQVLRRCALDCVGHLVGLFDRERRDRGECLLDIPRTTGDGVAKRRHDFDQAANIVRGLHGREITVCQEAIWRPPPRPLCIVIEARWRRRV